MSGIWLPGSALTISLLLIGAFFSKKRIDSHEVNIYSYILIINFLFSINALIGYILSKTIGIRDLIAVIQKFHLSLLVVIAACLFCYMLSIINDMKSKYARSIKIVRIITIIIICFVLLCPVKVINYGEILDVGGISYQVAMIGILLYFAGIVISNIHYFIHNKNHKKNLPFIILTLLFVIAFILRFYYPEIITETYCVSFALLVMYFTIENPDVKMLEKMELAKNEADKANRAKSDFLSSMSHEIRTPLNAIVGFSEMIKESDNLDEIHEDADDVIKASKTLLEIVNGILDISKIEAGKLEIINSPYNSKDLFNEVANLMKPKMNEKALDFQIEIAEDIPTTLYGDHSNIKKVITNILSNAYKYTEQGFVKYEVRCINNQNVSRIIISVEDSGRGIKKENIDKLFTKFQRLSEDKNTTIEGTGLGLAITKQIVELMGGKVIVQSVYGSGSKFTIILDQRIEKVEVKEKKTEIDENIDLTNKNILIVDDNSLNLKVATKLIDKYNAIIDTADSGFSCIDKIKSGNKYDLILLDDMMPKMSGVETLKKLKEIPNFNTPVVVLTANAITGMREKYLSEGFDNYLAKPINKDELLKVLVRYLIDQDRTIDFGDLPKEIYEIGNNDEIDIAQPTTNEENSNEEEVEELKKEDNEKSPIDYLKENHIDIDKAIELLGDIDIYNDTLKEFIDNSSKRKTKLDEYIKTNDMDNYSIEVHSLKSDSKYLGFTSLAGIAFEHETKSKENDLKYVKDNYNDLVKELDKMIDISNKYIEM